MLMMALARKGGIGIAFVKRKVLGRAGEGAAFSKSSDALMALLVVHPGQSMDAIVRIDFGL